MNNPLQCDLKSTMLIKPNRKNWYHITRERTGMNLVSILILCHLWLVTIDLQVSGSESGIKTGEESREPNIIVIYTDDHGWPDIGVQGIYDDLKTPHIDALARSGVIATSGYSTAPQCVPSRAGLLIGKSQNRFGVEANKYPLDGFDREMTIAERLQASGYVTCQIGKWHLGPVSEITRHGFDFVYARNSNRPAWANLNASGHAVKPGLHGSGDYHLDACSRVAAGFIERQKDSPFFLYLAFRAPHVPLDAPGKYLSRFPGEMPERRRQALAMISAMDDGVGLIRETLRKNNLLDDTLIFFMADNGAPLKIHKHDAPGGGPGWDGSLNDPMNGEKGMLSEGGIRVPYIVSFPSEIPGGGREISFPVSTLDVAATAMAVAGSDKVSDLDGINLIPFLCESPESPPSRYLAWRWVSQSAIRYGPWKFLKGGKREYLFNLDHDREEKVNLIHQYPAVSARLKTQLSVWAAGMKPPGLENQSMSDTWETYFDYYLDGKPAPPMSRAETRQSVNERDPVLHGWVLRHGSAIQMGHSVKVNPSGGRRSFLAMAGLDLELPLEVNVGVVSSKGGSLGIAWRYAGDKDFKPDNVMESVIDPVTHLASLRLPAAGGKKIIHLRLILPPGEVEVKSVSIMDPASPSQKPLHHWSFER